MPKKSGKQLEQQERPDVGPTGHMAQRGGSARREVDCHWRGSRAFLLSPRAESGACPSHADAAKKGEGIELTCGTDDPV